jgi:hypothetical protein
MKNKNYILVTLSLMLTNIYCWGQTVNEAPTINFEKNNISCYGESSGSIISFIEGGHPPYTLNWSNGEETEDIYNLSPGFYTLTVVDAAGSMNSRVTEITEPEELKLTSEIINPSSSLIEDGEIKISIDGGTPFKWTDTQYEFYWDNNNNTLDQSNIGIGVYTITIFDGNGCSLEESFTLTVMEQSLDNLANTEEIGYEKRSNIAYPNPSNVGDVVKLSYLSDVNMINIFSSNGKLIKSIDVIEHKDITLDKMEKGVYFIHFINDKKSTVFPMIVR